MDSYEVGVIEEMDNIPLISVIVPIYNVEPYLRNCLDSLKNQTLKQIEVIMIDDGSTDDSGKIAEEYVSETYPIFRCIHTENRGLSAARNRGIDEARAEWIMFVDSDDWVDREFCRISYKKAINNGSDLIIFGYFSVKNGWIIKNKLRFAGVLSREMAIKHVDSYAWNKLYRKYLFKIYDIL